MPSSDARRRVVDRGQRSGVARCRQRLEQPDPPAAAGDEHAHDGVAGAGGREQRVDVGCDRVERRTPAAGPRPSCAIRAQVVVEGERAGPS